ncbi:tyrosine-protein phosphatase [Halalkalibacter okhensis]|uniref:Tyrosine-protein phosphatase n=1 Tax=Halalkalibacter okhensis TaxID=333138 RepID=A0A0B0I726_9BACI|nr:CpsB/CapC family capsule biosynthesis tyrosine phosphatase [Halalkalibacter okhensis]KHF38253.1 tyrosine protein phosphatase [Halalkalibacter okhensis]
MIDIHCHILPGVDDGPKTLAESLELAKLAESEGITTIIATPHHHHPSFHNSGPSVIRQVEELNEAIKQAQIGMTVIPSQEVRIHGDIIQHVDLGDVLPMAPENSYILLEFPTNSVPHYAKKLFYDLKLQGITPIIAHPERNKAITEKPDILYDFVKDGVLTQITASSVTGHFGKKIMKFTDQLIESNLTHFLASDAHNGKERPFRLREAYSVVEDRFGIEMVYQLKENAELLLNQQHVQAWPPEPIRKKKRFFGIL